MKRDSIIEETSTPAKRKKKQQKTLSERQSATFMSFFLKKTDEKPKQLGWSHNSFKPFEIKSNMTLAPLLRRAPLSKHDYDNLLLTQVEASDYLKSVFGKKLPPNTKDPLRAKYFHFCENCRPPYYGTWRKVSKIITGRRPFALSHKELDYGVDSDSEWEEERAGEGEDCFSEKEVEESDTEDSEDSGFHVDDGYLSENEGSEASGDEGEDNARRRLRLNNRASEFKKQRKTRARRLKKRLSVQVHGLSWEHPSTISDNAIRSHLLVAVKFNWVRTQ